jgi:hypothetical protein
VAGAVVGRWAVVRARLGTRGADLQRHVCAGLEIKMNAAAIATKERRDHKDFSFAIFCG